MRELIDEGHLRVPRQHRVQVHLLEGGAAVGDLGPGDNLQVADLRFGLRAAVWLDVADDDIGATLLAAMAFVEQGERLADACRGAQVDPELAPAARHPGGANIRKTLGTHQIPCTERLTLGTCIPCRARSASASAAAGRLRVCAGAWPCGIAGNGPFPRLLGPRPRSAASPPAPAAPPTAAAPQASATRSWSGAPPRPRRRRRRIAG